MRPRELFIRPLAYLLHNVYTYCISLCEGIDVLCKNTGELQVVRLEHLDVKTVSKLNRIIGLIKRLVGGTARISFTLSGGHVDNRWEVSRIVPLPPDDEH